VSPSLNKREINDLQGAFVKNFTKIKFKQNFFENRGIKAVGWPFYRVRRQLVWLFLVLLQACGAPQMLTNTEETALLERVKARRACVSARDWQCMYQFLSPAYRRVFSEDMVAGRYAEYPSTVLTGVKLGAYDRDAAVASVEVGVMSRSSVVASSANLPVFETVVEPWIWKKGNWWYVPQ